MSSRTRTFLKSFQSKKDDEGSSRYAGSFQLIGAFVGFVIIIASSITIYHAINSQDPALNSFTGKVSISELVLNPSHGWDTSCQVTVRDEKNRLLTVSTRRDICEKFKVDDTLVMEAGQVILP